jgi:glycosyltransferase involved in cell wall biosynthesis
MNLARSIYVCDFARDVRCRSLWQADGIVNKGMVGQRELTEALSGCGFYLYTCEIGEISSISLMRAQAMGAVPITSRHTDSALNETAGWFDLGPPGSPGLIGRDPERLEAWVERVIYVANHASDFDEHRREMKAWARATFSWRRAGDQWDRIFQEGLRGPGSMDIDRIAPAQIPLHTRSTHPEL